MPAARYRGGRCGRLAFLGNGWTGDHVEVEIGTMHASLLRLRGRSRLGVDPISSAAEMRKPPWRGGFGVLLCVHDPRPPGLVPAVPKSRGGDGLHPCHEKSLTQYGDFGRDSNRGSGDRGVAGVERAQQVVAALWCIPVPQRTQFRDRRVVPVDTQVDQRNFPAPRPADVHCAPGRARRPRRGPLPARTAAVP